MEDEEVMKQCSAGTARSSRSELANRSSAGQSATELLLY